MNIKLWDYMYMYDIQNVIINENFIFTYMYACIILAIIYNTRRILYIYSYIIYIL